MQINHSLGHHFYLVDRPSFAQLFPVALIILPPYFGEEFRVEDIAALLLSLEVVGQQQTELLDRFFWRVSFLFEFIEVLFLLVLG